jgi:mono/diheme cytochrome c family protein
MPWLLSSRRNVLLVVLGLLLALDLGRSLYARIAYSQPYEHWNGEPYDLKINVWPPASNVPADASLGEQVFVENCAVCHGTDGKGNGVSAPSIYPRPRDFTQGLFKYKTTTPGQPPSDSDLINIVTNGLPASPMPYFSDILTAEEIVAVVDYLKGFSTVFGAQSPEAMTIPERVPSDAASIERGTELFKLNCAACHGEDARTRAELKDANGFTVHTRDLTAPWTFRGGSAPEQIWLRLTNGLAPSPMPSFAETLTDNERWDIVNFLESIARPAPWEPNGSLQGPGTSTDLVKRGEYLAHYEMCGLCHTQVGPFGIYRGDTHYLAGGMQVQAYPHGVFVSRNLTSDPETGLGNKTEEEIASIIRTGQASDRTVNFFGMPWMILHNLSQEDAIAMAKYLKTLPPVTSAAPPQMEYGFIESVVMKTAAGLPVANPAVLTYGEGSFADPNPGPLPADWPRRAMIWGQWLVIIIGVGLFLWAGPAASRFPHGVKGWLLTIIGTLGLSLVALIAAGIYNLPGLLPPDIVAEQVNASIYDPQPEDFATPQEYALVQRGKYLFSTTACSFCHGNDGSGGSKVNGQGLGTVWTRNISPDVATGIGGWSDAEIARAIRSGISADGRPLYWQGMPWDHFANLDEEDVRAIIIYLRALPPVTHAVPLPAPPQPDDCAIYTFYLSADNFEPGCK